MGKIGRACALSTLCLALLGGCHSAAEIQQRQLDAARGQCTTFGFKPDTPEFAQCVQTEFDQAAAQRRAALKAAGDAFKSTRPTYCLAGAGMVSCY